MGVKHRSGAAGANNLDVQERFRRRPGAWRAQDGALTIDLDDRIGVETSLEHSAPRHGKPQRVPSEHDAEVPTGPQDPIACVEAPPDLCQQSGGLHQVQ
jgi:hypothetical protein